MRLANGAPSFCGVATYCTVREGGTIEIPESIAEDFAYFTLDQLDAAKTYFRVNGYVVIRGPS